MMQIWQFWSFVYKTREINVADLGQFGVVHTKKYIKNICYTFKGNINWSFDSSICIITLVYANHTKYWVGKIFTFFNYLCITFRFQHHLHHRFSCNSCHFLSNENVLKVQTWYAESLIIMEDYVQIGHIKEQIQGYVCEMAWCVVLWTVRKMHNWSSNSYEVIIRSLFFVFMSQNMWKRLSVLHAEGTCCCL